ncbi:type II secretion system F family protein [Azospirillum sp. ST 5-10]|uniref:type II secretion system F family protein n=1 Tax=unclassified Azospirillum TaxID=2630922 RepID=UPI003F49C374
MPTFRYRAVGAGGEPRHGVAEAADEPALVQQLRAEGWLPLAIEPAAAGAAAAAARPGPRLDPRALALALRSLAMLSNAGLSLDQALDTAAAALADRRAAAVLRRARERVRAGATLADALTAQGARIDGFTLGMVRAGELAGRLAAAATTAADHLERAEDARERLRAALAYPAVLTVTVALSLMIIVTVVLPGFRDVFDGAGVALPWATAALLALGDAAARFWWLPALAAGAGGLLLLHRRRRPAGRLAQDRRLLALPVVGGILRQAETARLAHMLGPLLAQGIPMTQALPIARSALRNAALADAVAAVEREVAAGRGFAAPFAATGRFPPMAAQIVRIGEASGRLGPALAEVAAIADREVDRRTRRLTALLVPLLTVVLALVVGGIIVAVLLPILSLGTLAG